MKFLHDNEFLIFLGLVIIGALAMSFAIGQSFRGGNEWAYAHAKAHEIFALIVRAI